MAVAADAAVAELARQARADIEMIKQRVARIAREFFEIGQGLVRLKRPGVCQAVGYSSFHELCTRELGISGAKADEMVVIATSMSRELAAGLGHKNALALVTLCRATPEDDTPEELANKGTVALPSGGELTLKGSTVREKLAAAKAIRGAVGVAGKMRGRTTTAEERRIAAEAEARLHAAGFDRARVVALATRPGQGGDVRIDGIPIARLDAACAALCPRRRK